MLSKTTIRAQDGDINIEREARRWWYGKEKQYKIWIHVSRSFDEGDVFIFKKWNINVICFKADLIKHSSIAWIFWIHENLLPSPLPTPVMEQTRLAAASVKKVSMGLLPWTAKKWKQNQIGAKITDHSEILTVLSGKGSGGRNWDSASGNSLE